MCNIWTPEEKDSGYTSQRLDKSENFSLVCLDNQAVATGPWGTVALTSSLAAKAISTLWTE